MNHAVAERPGMTIPPKWTLDGRPTHPRLGRRPVLHAQTFPATNDLLGTYEGATGVKSGRTTEAGWCLVGSAERDGRSVVVAVLGASSDAARLASATALLDWAFAQP